MHDVWVRYFSIYFVIAYVAYFHDQEFPGADFTNYGIGFYSRPRLAIAHDSFFTLLLGQTEGYCLSMLLFEYARVFICMHVCMLCMNVCMHVYACVCLCLFNIAFRCREIFFFLHFQWRFSGIRAPLSLPAILQSSYCPTCLKRTR